MMRSALQGRGTLSQLQSNELEGGPLGHVQVGHEPIRFHIGIVSS